MYRTPPHKMSSQKGKNEIPECNIEQKLNETVVLNADTTTKKSPGSVKSKHSQGKSSVSSSILARRRQLELQAAEAKMQLQMDIIDKKLALELAELEEEQKYSPRVRSKSSRATSRSCVEKWIDQSQRDLESLPAHEHGMNTGEVGPPPTAGGTEGTLQLLACAVKDLAAATSYAQSNSAQMLSRLSTPKDLPIYSGDPLEWLHFKQAYIQSTQLCNFTPEENLWRLRKCLQGPAKETVAALLVSATSPDIVLSTLELQYGNADIIITRLLLDLKRLQPMSQEYHKDIVTFSIKIQNFVAAVKSLNRDRYLNGSDIAATILSKMPTVLLSKWVDYRYLADENTSKLPLLSEFLHKEAVKVSTSDINLLNIHDSVKRKLNNDNRPHHVLFQTELKDDKCPFCRDAVHSLPDCRKFKKALRKDRWQHVKRFGICYKCLTSRHERESCSAAACDIDNCGQAHHRLLHFMDRNITIKPNEVHEVETQTDFVTNINVKSSRVMLKVVPISIHGPNGVISASALLDDGSSVSLISSELAARAGLRGSPSSMAVRGAWPGAELRTQVNVLNCGISAQDGTEYNITMRSVDQLNLPTHDLSGFKFDEYVHLSSIRDKICCDIVKPEVLIGQDNYQLLLPLEIIVGKVNEPCATRSALGWSIHGAVHSPGSPNTLTQQVTLLSEDERILNEIQEEVRRSFTVESMGISDKPRPNMDDIRAWECLEQTSRLEEGRWYVGLPWKHDNCKLPDSYPNALSRLKGVEKKMESSPEYASRYKDRIQHLLDNDFASELSETTVSPKTWYLAHFGVDNPNKKKLRLVFDSAAPSNGLSLNDFLLKGPDLLASLFGIMLRFRENRVAVTGDIKDMFLRVKVRPEDQDALRFLWRDDNTKQVKTFVMTSLIFGANCSPFIAQFIKNKNAQRFESTKPSAVEAICSQHYMDDYIDSVPDEETAVKLVREVTHIHKEGGFEIVNWTSNSKEVLNSIPDEALGSAAVKFKIGQPVEGERTLGLIWNPKNDLLSFDVSLKRISREILSGEQRPTKRQMLRVIMSIFDVYGFLAPFTIKGKIMLQQTWQSQIGWDDILPDDIYRKWLEWINLLRSIETVHIPRHYNAVTVKQPDPIPPASATGMTEQDLSTATTLSGTSYNDLELHLFCDASMKAMCAVAYWRWKDCEKTRVAFIASKCRVAPVKQLSVPRLELQSAVLAARLADTIEKEHKIKPTRRVFWSDSTTVLHWVRNNARNYKTFVAHRLGEIDELTRSTEWRYVPTKVNVADMATRDDYDGTIFESDWLHGPAFLYSCEEFWPQDVVKPEIRQEVLEHVHVVNEKDVTNLPVPDCTRFSSWRRLLGASASVLKFIDKCRKPSGLKDDSVYLEQAERFLIQQAQRESFEEEVNALKKGKPLERNSRLHTLSPYLDENEILRVGGRIDVAADVSLETKRPVILDGRHHMARLIAYYFHVRAAHSSQETVVNELKQRYWILQIRPTVKHVVSRCLFCRIRNAQPFVPRMGDLPAARVAHHQRPFSHTGLDLFGPMEVTVGRHKEKRYGVLFTCLTIRAVHIEIVNSLTTDSLIMALRRMAARRGWPKHLYSDNGTNLRGASMELKRACEEIDEDLLKREALAVNKELHWTFIPPASPHWGGAWERLIRSVKVTLKVVLKERAPRDETLATLIAEVESMVNSRPLTHVTVEPGSNESITPNHFLLTTSSTLPVPGRFNDSDLHLRKQWRISQRLADMFWKRWMKEVLPEMLPRKKWTKEQKNLEVGDLVLIVDPEGPRNVWPRGVIQHVFPGKDNRVRVVLVKTNSGVLKRSVSRVARILSKDECC